MPTFFIEQFGCRATQADAAAIERQLRDRGYARAHEAGGADVVVVNTCTVTASADAQARNAIGAIHRGNPAARILVTGCYAQRAPEELAALSGVTWVVGNSHKAEIPALLETARTATAAPDFFPVQSIDSDAMSLARGPAKILTGNIFEQTEIFAAPIQGGEAGHTRPILKIQDGCDSRCAYCVIPYVRGRSRSLAPERVIEEIAALVSRGAREIVLSGINLGTYGRDLSPRVALGDLLRRILGETSLERLRLSSIEPQDVTADLVALFASSPRLARHFHVPLQSGSDRILAAMHRWYRAGHYARRVELVREALPDAAIGADVIAGFPGETDEDHAATLDFIERSPLTYLHVFSFSARPGTPAAHLGSQISASVIARRARELRALGESKKEAFREAQAGCRMRLLTLNRRGEDAAGPWTGAISGNYLDVRIAGRRPANQWLNAEISYGPGGHLTARVPCA